MVFIQFHASAALQVRHAVAFVAEIPASNCRMILHLLHETADKTDFPLNRLGILEDVFRLKRGRNEEASAHPAGQKSDNEFDSVLFRRIAEKAETVHHLRIHAGGVLKRSAVLSELLFHSAAAVETGQRLEIRPQREHAENVHAVFRDQFQILFNIRGTPVAPHVNSRMGRPVVAARKKIVFCKNIHCLTFIFRFPVLYSGIASIASPLYETK